MSYEPDLIELDILNALYFTEPHAHIVEEVEASPQVINDCLRNLLAHKFISAMIWNDEKSDYVMSFMYDSDNLEQYSFVSTKLGLEAHLSAR